MSVSIVIPYFNRKKFEKLIEYNINIQTYHNIKEVIIADDSTLPNQQLHLEIPYTILYYKVPRMTIGAKRNFLKSKATGEYICHFDTDDNYCSGYIQSCMNTMIKYDCDITGSSDMLFVNYTTKWCGRQSCKYLNQLNEATMLYKKSYADTHHYADRSHSENESFTNEVWRIRETPIEEIMVCTCHGDNTIDKNVWQTDQYKSKLPRWFWAGKYYSIAKQFLRG